METPRNNLVFHEFAHQLDMLNGRLCDGMPVLETSAEVDRWISLLGPEFDRPAAACSRGHRGVLADPLRFRLREHRLPK
jgi:Mlc titration factor MtfA (ptsG expression regulator)